MRDRHVRRIRLSNWTSCLRDYLSVIREIRALRHGANVNRLSKTTTQIPPTPANGVGGICVVELDFGEAPGNANTVVFGNAFAQLRQQIVDFFGGIEVAVII